MTQSSILGVSAAPPQADGKNTDALGPSDSSDSGSDVQGERAMQTAPDAPDEWGAVITDLDSDSDAGGTGERASADGDAAMDGADIMPDRIIDSPGGDDDPPGRRRSFEASELSADDADDSPEDDDEASGER